MASDERLDRSTPQAGLKQAREEKGALIFKPGAGRLPSPEALARYAEIDPSYPQSLMESLSWS